MLFHDDLDFEEANTCQSEIKIVKKKAKKNAVRPSTKNSEDPVVDFTRIVEVSKIIKEVDYSAEASQGVASPR